jgi:hypothetical protein
MRPYEDEGLLGSVWHAIELRLHERKTECRDSGLARSAGSLEELQ